MYSKPKSTIRLCLFTALVQAAMISAPASADTFDDLRVKWVTRTDSAPPLPADDPDVALQNTAGSTLPQQYFDTMSVQPGRTSLWPDLPLGSESANVTASVARLSTLMTAYSTQGSSLYQDQAVAQAVLDGFDWILANHYKVDGVGYGNWWDWQIGVPANLNSFMMLNYNRLTQAQIAAAVASIDHYSPDPARRAAMDGTVSATSEVEVGANLLDKALAVVLRGILVKDSAKIAAGRNAAPAVLPPVDSGDGFYADGTFIQHKRSPYVGSYGLIVLNDLTRLYYLLNNTPWSFVSEPYYLKPFEWAMDSFRPMMYDGALLDNQRGRAISRRNSTDHVVGRQTVGAFAELAQVMPAVEADQLKSVIKGWVERDDSFGASYFTRLVQGGGVPVYHIALIKAIMNDPNVVAAQEVQDTRFYPAADRAVMRGPGYAFALSTFSQRITAFEYTNGENLKGWWTGMGMTFLYNADQTQYSKDYWPTVDMWRLPGTTTDGTGSGVPTAGKHQYNIRTGVGGAELNRRFATVAMEFSPSAVTGSPLNGKKAWFLFGDRIVAVGAAITNTNGAKVETIVENRRLNQAGDNQLTVNSLSTVKPAQLGWTEAMPATSWAHLGGNTPHGSDIGYVFPDSPTVTALRESRSGTWRDLNTSGSSDVVVNNFLSLSLNHGVNPTNSAYTYILLPNRTAEETAEFAAANPITVIERSSAATAVKDNAQGVTGIVFWNNASKTVSANGQPLLTADRKAVVTMQQQGSDLQLVVADPTQTHAGLLNLELHARGDLVSKDNAVTILNPGESTIKIAVNVDGAKGAPFKARFAMRNQITLSPSGDAFVRDGTYAGTNYGTARTLTVKGDSVNYARRSLLGFDLSAITGTIVSAKLKLVPTAAGDVAGVVHHLYQTGEGWGEGSVTWTSMPVNGPLLASWSIPAINTPVELDITDAANSVMNGSKKLSMKVEAAAVYSAAASVDYGAREHVTAAYRPVLSIVYE